MNGIDYIDLYYEFQDRFKPVKDFKSLEEIVLKAMQYLVDIMKIHSESDFIKHIHLVYPNYFREVSKGQYQPFLDELICFNDGVGQNEELRKRVGQHMGYYLKDDSVGSPDFIRISKSLMENPEAQVKDFYVQKDNNTSTCSKYLVTYNSLFTDKVCLEADCKFPENLCDDLVEKGGHFEPYFEEYEEYKDNIIRYSVKGIPCDAKMVSLHSIQNAQEFIDFFAEPLSAHFVLLGNSSLLYVYSQTAQIGKTDSSLGYGGLFVLIDSGLSDDEVLDYIRFFRLIGDNISTCIAHNIMSYKQKNEARKSAKVAIMSRNISHNLGSHVMSYLKQHLSSVTSMLKDNILTDFFDSRNYEELRSQLENAINNGDRNPFTFTKDIAKVEDDIALPFLVGLGNFVSYLQERQDFIATIATDYIPYYSTVNFKDFIYDELNPDKRYERHQDRKNFKPDNILLGNIARSEGLGRKISPTEADNARMADIIIKFKDFDGNAVVNDSNIPLSGRDAAFNSLDFMRKIDVSLPGGIIGRQAVFSIIENIIRNAAKHGNWRPKGGLELTFDIVDKNDIKLVEEKKELENEQYSDGSDSERNSRLKEITDVLNTKDDSVEDHLSLNEVIWLFYSKSIDADDLFFFTVTDNLKTQLQDVKDIREALREDYIKEDGSMEEGNKGIKELRISAAWLRGAKDESEYYYPNPEKKITKPQSEKKAPLMYVRLSNPNSSMTGEGHLQYIFCLPVPKMVAIVTSDNSITTINSEVRQKLKSNYWNVFSPKQFKEESNKSYAFVLCDGEACFKEIRPYSSSRIMKLEDTPIDNQQLFDDLKRGITCEECKSIEDKLYEHLAGRCVESEIICIDDKKTKAKIENLKDICPESVVEYRWEPQQDKGTFVRSDGIAVKVEKDERTDKDLYDGMRLVPSQNYYKVGNIVITDGGGFGRYVYRTHHDTNEQFKLFMGDLRNNFKGCQFVESITGNTSTDRLVRNDTLNQRWFFSHLRAMKQKVAIFDERLFSKIYGLEELNFTHSKAIKGTLEDMKTGYAALLGPNFEEAINSFNSIDDLTNFINSNKRLRKKLYSPSEKTKGNEAIMCYQKGICIFTFIKNIDHSNSYDLYGLFVKSSDDVFSGAECDDNYRATCEKLATLSWENETLVFDSESYKNNNDEICKKFNYNSFDYISIHQGLLDKLYESFGIKDKPVKKDELTRRLYLLLKSGADPEGNIIEVSADTDTQKKWSFLPGMTIHSGRSKPGKQDMPQLLPFIQYSSIEHATLDCKYSLIELLDNARYE